MTERATEIQVECTCGNKRPDIEIVNVKDTRAITVRCEECQASYLRILHAAQEDEVLKGPGLMEV